MRAIRQVVPEPPKRERSTLPADEPPERPAPAVKGVTVTVHDQAGNVLASE